MAYEDASRLQNRRLTKAYSIRQGITLWFVILLVIALVQWAPFAGAVAKASSHLCQLPTVSTLEINRLEITQSIQDSLNTISLISARSTTVRAMLRIANSSATSWTWITGRLTVTTSTTTHVYSQLAIIRYTPQGAFIPGKDDCTLTFDLSLPLPATVNAAVTLDIFQGSFSSSVLASKTVANLSVNSYANSWSPHIYFVPIDYTPDSQPYPVGIAADTLHDQLNTPRGNAFVWGMLPVNDHTSTYQRLASPAVLPFAQDDITNSTWITGIGEINVFNPAEGCALAKELSQMRSANVINGLGPTSQDFLYGWVYGKKVIDQNGYGAVYGRVAYGNTEVDRGQRTFAHELLHNFGDDHVALTTTLQPAVGWDVGGRLVNSWGGNGITNTIKHGHLNAIMVPGLKTYQAWSTMYEYEYLRSEIAALPQVPERDAELEKSYQVVVDACAEPSGDRIVGNVSVVRYPWYIEPTARYLPGGPFTLTLQHANCDPTEVSFDGRVGTDPDDSAEVIFYGLLHVVADVPLNCTLEELTIERDGLLLYAARVVAGQEPPTLDINVPRRGDELAQGTAVVWLVNDTDTPPENITSHILYSYDEGNSWTPLRVGIEGVRNGQWNRIIVDTNGLPRLDADQMSMIRVVVSDGLHTVYQDITDLTAIYGVVKQK